MAAILNSGLLNPTLWAAAVAFLYLAGLWPGRLPRWVRLGAVVALGVGAGASFAAGLYRAYVAPRDVMQDIIAAREYAAGRPMHPSDMTVRIGAALAEEGPRPSPFARWPELARREREQYQQTLTEHWVQAHPPPMTLLTVPFVAGLGVLGTQAAYSALATAALALTLWLLKRELWPDGRGLLPAAIALAVFGSAPVVTAFRCQPPEVFLVALLAAAWAWLRRGRGVPAGVAVALAVALKLAPGLLAVPLLVRHRRAAVALVLTGLAILAGLAAAVPASDLRDYRETAAGVVEEYGAFPSMISLEGVFARGARFFGVTVEVGRTAWTVTVLAVVAAWAVALARRPVADPRSEVDYEFAVGTALVPLLSPIAWDHYLIFLILPLAVLADRVLRPEVGRAGRIGLGLLLVAVTLPDSLFLWAIDHCQGPGWDAVRVWGVEAFRAYVMVALAGWLAWLWFSETAGTRRFE